MDTINTWVIQEVVSGYFNAIPQIYPFKEILEVTGEATNY